MSRLLNFQPSCDEHAVRVDLVDGLDGCVVQSRRTRRRCLRSLIEDVERLVASEHLPLAAAFISELEVVRPVPAFLEVRHGDEPLRLETLLILVEVVRAAVEVLVRRLLDAAGDERLDRESAELGLRPQREEVVPVPGEHVEEQAVADDARPLDLPRIVPRRLVERGDSGVVGPMSRLSWSFSRLFK